MSQTSRPQLERALFWGVVIILGLFVLVVMTMVVGIFTGHIDPSGLGEITAALAGTGLLGLLIVCAYVLRMLVKTWQALEEARQTRQSAN